MFKHRYTLAASFLWFVAAAGRCPAQGASANLTVLFDFSSSDTGNGYTAYAPLTAGEGGILYGTTALGGDADGGAVYSMTPPATAGAGWTEKVIYSFPRDTADGVELFYGLAVGPGGVLYGATVQGGPSNCGTVFELAPPSSEGAPWTESTIFLFDCGEGGNAPRGTLAIGNRGQLYGVTQHRGSGGAGLVYELRPPDTVGGSWTEKVLHKFTGSPDGYQPMAGIVEGPDGILYGTTQAGGTPVSDQIGRGTVFSLAPPKTEGGEWTETIIHDFGETREDHGLPLASVVLGDSGVLYGSAFSQSGTVFALYPPASPGGSWTEDILYAFQGYPDGSGPKGNLALGSGGVLYGTTSAGGTDGWGIVFSLTPPASPGGAWSESILWDFTQGADGAIPNGGLLFIQGRLYGTTSLGSTDAGPSGGSVFALTP